jgi:uncharacterized protein
MAERASYAPGAPNWADLTIPDLDAALAFYGGLFGWEFEDQGEEAGHYNQALKDGKRVAGIGPNQPGTPPMAFWTTYLTGTDAMFGIWEPGEHKGAQLHDEHAALSWNELLTHDLDAAVRFYGSLFDYTFEPLPDEPDSYQVLKLGNDYVGGIWRLTDETPARWVAYFKLDDVDAGFERARELGGELTADPVDSQYGRWAPVRDPQGAEFRLISTTP